MIIQDPHSLVPPCKILNLIPFRRYNNTPPPCTCDRGFLQVFFSCFLPFRRTEFAAYDGKTQDLRLGLGTDLRVCKVDVEFIAIVLGFFLGLSPRPFQAVQ